MLHWQPPKKAHGFDEETYRDILARYGATEKDGKISATTMTPAQMFSALDHLNGNYHEPVLKPRTFDGENAKQLEKMMAIWTKLYRQGKLTQCQSLNHAIHSGIDAWALRQFGVAKINWLSPEQLKQAIEQLKKWGQRDRTTQTQSARRRVG